MVSAVFILAAIIIFTAWIILVKPIATYKELAHDNREMYMLSKASAQEAQQTQDLKDINEDYAGWIKLEGTAIDYPVVLAASRGQEYWLKHDFYGKRSYLGTPFIDAREDMSSNHLLIYAHHISLTHEMFSDVACAYKEDVFKSLGKLSYTDNSGKHDFYPAYAQIVDKDFENIQAFNFTTQKELSDWTFKLMATASVKSSSAEVLALRSKRVITLCTCSSNVINQRQRTLVTFIET